MTKLRDIVIDPELLQYATASELDYYTKILKAQKALQSPLDYACYVTPIMQRYPHLEYLNAVLVALAEKRLYKSGPGPAPVRVFKTRVQNRGRKDKKGRLVHPETGEPVLFRLGVNMPPRHGKSMLISEHFIPWYMTAYPDETLIFVTHSGKFSSKWGRLGRQHINEHPELEMRLSAELQSSTDWGIEGTRGGVIFRGAGGSITGEGGNGVIDDPVSGEEEASNPEQMEKLWEWWNGTMRSRIQSEKFLVLIQTRWAFNDPTGKFRETENDKWFWVTLPALAYDDTNEDGVSVDVENDSAPDPLGRSPGDALCPEMYDEEWLEEQQEASPYWFDPLYQARPSSSSTGLFKTFNHYQLSNGVYTLFKKDGTTELVAESRCYRFATMDLAATTKNTSDWTVFMVWDVTPDRKMLIRHVERVRIPADQHKKFTYEQAAKWRVRWVGIENATYGLALNQKLIKEGKIIVRKLQADKDKVSRAIVGAEMLQNEQIFSSLDAAWSKEFEQELKRFLKQKHDDQVDTFAYGALQLESVPVSFGKQEPPPKPTTAGRIAVRRRRKKSNAHDDVGNW